MNKALQKVKDLIDDFLAKGSSTREDKISISEKILKIISDNPKPYMVKDDDSEHIKSFKRNLAEIRIWYNHKHWQLLERIWNSKLR
jgi:hypothetical protein